MNKYYVGEDGKQLWDRFEEGLHKIGGKAVEKMIKQHDKIIYQSKTYEVARIFNYQAYQAALITDGYTDKVVPLEQLKGVIK